MMFVVFLFKGFVEIIYINMLIVLIVVGGKVELQCVLDGDFIFIVMWYSFNGIELVIIIGDSIIFIVVDGLSDFGDY